MKICPKCNTQVNDDAGFCTNCGVKFAEPQPAQPTYTAQQPVYTAPVAAPRIDPYDHTAEFDPKDIADNKVIAMLVYLLPVIGIIIALLANSTSKYVSFHLRQALKFLVIETLVPIALVVSAVINIIPFLGWAVYGLAIVAAFVLYIALFVVKIICFFSICNGKAKEPAIIRWFGFLR